MDQETIEEIAQEVVRQLPNYSWQLLVVQAVLMLLAFGGGAFFGAYLRTRPTKVDFDGVQDQFRRNARLVETLKAEIGQANWRQREWANLRRMKLEVLLTKMHDCESYLEQLQHGAAKAAHLEERDPPSELDVITTLYFPELKVEVDDYVGKCRAQKTIISETLSETEKLGAPLQPIENVGADVNGTEFEAARERLSAAAHNLTIQIMGMAE